MLMDLFFDSVPIKKKRRIHFHEFMIEVHDSAHVWRNDKNRKSDKDPLPQIAEGIAAAPLFFASDEFHVTNIADAMILGRLFTGSFDLGVVVVTTSNFEPDNLYKGGLQRERFLPFYPFIERKTRSFRVSIANRLPACAIETDAGVSCPLGYCLDESAGESL